MCSTKEQIDGIGTCPASTTDPPERHNHDTLPSYLRVDFMVDLWLSILYSFIHFLNFTIKSELTAKVASLTLELERLKLEKNKIQAPQESYE